MLIRSYPSWSYDIFLLNSTKAIANDNTALLFVPGPTCIVHARTRPQVWIHGQLPRDVRIHAFRWSSLYFRGWAKLTHAPKCVVQTWHHLAHLCNPTNNYKLYMDLGLSVLDGCFERETTGMFRELLSSLACRDLDTSGPSDQSIHYWIGVI